MHEVENMVTGQWRFMGYALGIDDHKLEHINNMCLHPKGKALSTLNKWCGRQAGNTRKETLIKCLESIGRKDIADRIRDMG